MTTPAEVLAANGLFAELSSANREAFLRACKDGPTDVVRAFLAIGMPVDSRADISHETALIKAAEGGSVERLALLLDHGANLELIDSSEDNAFRTALNWSHPEAARFLASRGSNLNAVNRWGEDSLLHAYDKGQSSNVDLLLELGANPNVIGGENCRSITRKAIDNNDVETVRKLLDHKLDPNLRIDTNGTSALQHAINAGSMAIAQLLIERGADLSQRDFHENSALDAAALAGSWFLDELGVSVAPDALAKANARAAVFTAAAEGRFVDAIALCNESALSLDAVSPKGRTMLSLAVEQGSVEDVRRLLEAGASADFATRWGVKALAWAKTESPIELFELLVEHGARAVGADGKPLLIHSAVWNENEPLLRLLLRTAPQLSELAWTEQLSAAVMKKNVAIVRALHEAGAPLNGHAEIGGDTALHGACTAYRSDAVIAYLLANGADPNGVNHQQFTPLHSALQHYAYDDSYYGVIRALVNAGARWDVVDSYARTPYECARDLSKEHAQTIVVNIAVEYGASLDELTPAQNWATLAIWYDARRRDEVLAFIARGVSVEPPAEIKSTPLLNAAIRNSDVELVRAILDRGASATRAEQYGTTPLHHAAEAGSIELCELLIARGADVRAPDDWKSTPLHNATSHTALLRWMLDRGYDAVTGSVSTPLLFAVGRENVESVRLLLERGADPSAADSYNGAAIFTAIEKRNEAIVSLLVERGARTDVLGQRSGDTPLIAAAKTGNTAMVRALLDRGADVLAKNKDGDDALTFFAARKELRSSFADVLAKHGVDVSAPANIEPLPEALRAPSPWFRKVYAGELDAMRAAIAAGQPVDERDPYGATALMYAVESEYIELVQMLIDAGADVLAKDAEGTSVSGYVSLRGNEAIDALIEAKAGGKQLSMDVLNERAGRSLTADDARKMLERGELKKLTELVRARTLRPYTTVGGRSLHNIAAAQGDSDLVDFLLALGLDVSLADLRGDLPLLTALRAENFDVAEELLRKGATLTSTVRGKALVNTMLEAYSDSAVDWLLARGAKPSGLDAEGCNALLLSIRDSRGATMIRALLESDPSMARERDYTGRSALHWLMQSWMDEPAVAELLIDNGCDVHSFDDDARTPLHVAVEVYCEGGARVLLARGASWDFVAPDLDDARSARELAEEYGMDPANWPSTGEDDGSGANEAAYGSADADVDPDADLD